MYTLSEEEIEYILGDLERRGIATESLRLDLLDHLCCIIELEMKEGDDFKTFYERTLPLFYRSELAEIEEETVNLLTYKNYYAMKRLMMVSGAFAVFAFILGSFLKVMAWPAANVSLVLAVAVLSVIFLPLVYLLKLKETKLARDKWLIGMGTVVGVLYGLSALFHVHHWPGARIMWFSTLGLAFFIILPLYFFTGIRRPETKMNTIVVSVLLVGILGVQFLETSVRPHKRPDENKPQTEVQKLPVKKVNETEVVY